MKQVDKYLVQQDNIMPESAADAVQTGWIEMVKVSDYVAMCSKVNEQAREIAALKAQPSGVVLPERRPEVAGTWGDMGDAYNAGVNDTIDEVARLNQQPASGGDDDDQAYDAEAERLTAEALGVGAGINPNATSMDDIFLDASGGDDAERAAFEREYLKANYPRVHSGELSAPPIFGRVGSHKPCGQSEDDYEDSGIQRCWVMWQARAALPVREAVADGWQLVPVQPSFEARQALYNSGFEAPDNILDYAYRSVLGAVKIPVKAYREDTRKPHELSTAGCRCVRFGEGNPHWPCELHTAKKEQADLVAVWRCRIAGSEGYAYFPSKRCRFCEPLYAAPSPSREGK